MPIYRFIQNAFYEIDIEAETQEDATKIAEKDWQERFGQGIANYGYVYFDEIVEEQYES